jgi:glutamate synthase (NADPH/NADH) small chain
MCPVDKDTRGNAKASTDFIDGYATNVPKVFAAGEYLMGASDLPR